MKYFLYPSILYIQIKTEHCIWLHYQKGRLKTLKSGFQTTFCLGFRCYFFNSAKISSTVFFASPKHITLFSLKNSGFCTPA